MFGGARSPATVGSVPTAPRRRVLIVETQIKHYRKPFFTELATRLDQQDIDLRVVYSPPSDSERAKADTVDLDASIGIKVPGWWLLGDRALIQPIWKHVRAADLVISEQANKLLFNYVLLALSRARMKRIAYWGHGYNHQEREPGVSEWLKRRLLTRVDWWFSYTDSVTKYLTDHGVRPQMISTVYNTIDVAELRSAVENVDVAGTRSRIGIAADASVALFCGALTVAKNLSFLLEVSRRVRSLVPTFELVIVGDGPARETLEREARDMPYVHFAGAAFADARAPFFAVADVLAMPSQVGLSAVDAFAAGIPIFTTDLPTHGPELDYLEPGVNAMITSYSPVAFADTLVEVLRDRQRLDRMKQAALATAQRLPLSRMVDAFADGILRCLQGDVS